MWQVGFVVLHKKIPAQNRLHLCNALVDTGASVTCISSSVIRELKLSPRGKTELQSANGTEEVNVYDVQPVLIIPKVHETAANTTKTTMAMQALQPIRSPEFNPGTSEYKALIERDILQQGILTMDLPDGTTSRTLALSIKW